MRRLCFTILFGFYVSAVVSTKALIADSVWQWSEEVTSITINGSDTHPRVFLWIPPECRNVRAVVFSQNNMIEEGVLEHPEFRAALAKLGIAELYAAPTFDYWQDATNNDATNEKFNAVLAALAQHSGYDELTFAPIVPMGHSAMASFPWNFAAWNPRRTLAILSIHGDAPQTTLVGNGRPNVDWGNRRIDGIPGLMVMSEYEWWEDRLAPAISFRARNPASSISVLCDVGHGHFDYSDELVRYLALFIRKAAGARLPAKGSSNQPVALIPVDPATGWLMDHWRPNEKPCAKPAPFAKYTGDKSQAFWTFDHEMARATENFNPQFGKAPQLVGFVQDGKVVDQTPDTHPQIYLKVPALDDSLTFRLEGAFLNSVPAGRNPAKWTGLTNGTLLGHAAGGEPVVLSRISGPVIQTAPDAFAIRFNRSSIAADRRAGDIWLLAGHPGDANYKSAVQQGLLTIPFRLKEGAEQRINFPTFPDMKHGVKSLQLAATSDSGAPVYYYVREGPSKVEGNVLKFTPIPVRARLPIAVTVMAWQYGRTVEPKLKSADPVQRTFHITE